MTAKVGVDAAVFDEHDRILLVRRADDDKWGLIAGWVDGHEAPEETILREIAEEVGLTAAGRRSRRRVLEARERPRQPAQRRLDRLPVSRGERRVAAPAPRGPRDRLAVDRRRRHRRVAPPSRAARPRRARSPLAAPRPGCDRASMSTSLSLAEAVCLTLVAERTAPRMVDRQGARARRRDRPRLVVVAPAHLSRARRAGERRADRAPWLGSGLGSAPHDLAGDAEGPPRRARGSDDRSPTSATCAPSSC